jgi:hypothetical protein
MPPSSWTAIAHGMRLGRGRCFAPRMVKTAAAKIDDSVKQAFQTGLFTLSEIVFDKDHRRAVVTYSFVCGTLCGNGDTLLLKKVGQHWRVAKRCGGWIS